MTITTPAAEQRDTRLFAVDLHLAIHKGIRTLLFDATAQAGRIDPADAAARGDVAAKVDELAFVLDSHAHHEDRVIGPVLTEHAPTLADQISVDHVTLDARVEGLRVLGAEAKDARGAGIGLITHTLYLELASFTSAYLAHQDVEERVVMPAIEDAVGIPGCGELHGAIVGSIPPDEMAMSLSFMLPAMNIDDRAVLLGGMQANAPAPVFEGIWALAGTVLTATDHAALGARLGLS